MAFPSHGREYQPQAALLHQFPPFLAQRQLGGSLAASAPARQTGRLLALLPSVLRQCFGVRLWFALVFGSEPKTVSYAALELLFEEHLSPLPFPGLKLLFRGKGVGGSYSQVG